MVPTILRISLLVMSVAVFLAGCADNASAPDISSAGESRATGVMPTPVGPTAAPPTGDVPAMPTAEADPTPTSPATRGPAGTMSTPVPAPTSLPKPTGTPSPSATPEPAPSPQPTTAPVLSPGIRATPPEGIPGHSTRVRGSNFPALSTVSALSIGGVSILPDTPVETASDGSFAVWTEVAGLDAGEYALSATVGDITATNTFTVLAKVQDSTATTGRDPTTTPTPSPSASAENLPWVKDGLNQDERFALRRFHAIADENQSFAKAILEFGWFRDGIQFPEPNVMSYLAAMVRWDPEAAQYALTQDWVADGLTVEEYLRLGDMAGPAYEALANQGQTQPSATAAPTPQPPATPEPAHPALAGYHAKLQEAVMHPAPPQASDKGFLADGVISEVEIKALDRAQSVFGIPAFYEAWELDSLRDNEVQAVLYMLSFYDPYTVVHDITADPDDPNAEGADLSRALDDFGIYPGSCVYCKGQDYPTDDWRGWDARPTFHRTKLLNLVHHATVQAEMLSPCDLNDYSEVELLALRVMDKGYVGARLLYGGGMLGFTQSVRLTQEMLDSARRGTAAIGVHQPWLEDATNILVRPGEILSPFTHAIRAAGGPPGSRGPEQCLKAVEGIVDWERNRYIHFGGTWEEYMPEYYGYIFPENPHIPPVWASFLVYESGGQDKGERLAAQFRALNIPAVKDPAGIRLDENAENFIIGRGRFGIFLPTFGLYIHRNIGFSIVERQRDVASLIRDFHIPDHCTLELGEGSFGNGTGYLRYVCADTARAIDDPPLGTFTTISAGTEHVCALMADGTPVCWGKESAGRSSPPAGIKFATISAGYDHTCGLTADGTPVCWGNNADGQASPPQGEEFIDVRAGFGYTCGLRMDGSPSCWGYDLSQGAAYGSVYLQEALDRFLSSKFVELDVADIYDVCGLRANGELLCATGKRNFLAEGAHGLSSGIHAACALRYDNQARCIDTGVPELLTEEFTKVSVGSESAACGLRPDGTVFCWGEASPGDPPAGDKFMDISVFTARGADNGRGHACGLRMDGTAVCWGSNERGQASPPG